MSRLCDLTGATIGSLKVIRRIAKDEPEYDKNHSYYICSCLACGKDELLIRGDHLKESKRKSHKGCPNRKQYFESLKHLDLYYV